MFEFVLLVLFGILYFNLRGRVNDLRAKAARLEDQVFRLTARTFELERRLAGDVAPDEPLPQPAVEAAAVEAAAPEAAVSTPELEIPAPPEPPAAPPIDWEALIGGNILNKIGVLVLVIGVALFLAYGVTQLGPGGRVAVGLAVGVSLLAAGVAMERMERYVFWARGLIGGGWAIVYFTTYALHALPAAKIVDDPVMGAALLFLAAAGFVLHSLHYRSEVVTGLAYLAAFLALVFAPRTALSLQASVPLAVSLVWIAGRFEWRWLAAGGLVFTYATFAGAQPPHATWPVLWIYWLLFEAYDLRTPRSPLMPLNAAGFLGASMLLWKPDQPGFDWYLTAAALAQVASALLRWWLRGREETPEQIAEGGFLLPALLGLGLLQYAAAVRFEGPAEALALFFVAELAVLAGAFAGLRILQWIATAALLPSLYVLFDNMSRPEQFSYFGLTLRVWTPVAILLAAAMFLNRAVAGWQGFTYLGTVLLMAPIGHELSSKREPLGWMTLAAVLLQRGYAERWRDFRWAALGCGAFASLVLMDSASWRMTLAGASIAAAAAAQLAYCGARFSAAGAGTGAVVLAAFALARALPPIWVAPAWAALLFASTAVAVRVERRFAAFGGFLFALAVVGRAISENFPDTRAETLVRWETVLLTVILLYAAQVLLGRGLPVFTALGTLLLTSLIVDESSGRVLTMALAAEAVGLLIAGFLLRERPLRLSGLALFLFCVLKVFLYDLRELDTMSRILSFVVLGLLLVGASWIYTRFREQIQRYL